MAMYRIEDNISKNICDDKLQKQKWELLVLYLVMNGSVKI